MLETPQFLETYLAGDHRPAEIMHFEKSHRIIINRMIPPGFIRDPGPEKRAGSCQSH